MSKTSQKTHTRRTLQIAILAILACLLWSTAAAHAQTPFDAQYDPPTQTNGPPPDDPPGGPPSDPPGTPSGDPDSPRVLSDTQEPDDGIDLLPTTGGFGVAPMLLGTALIGAACVIAVRRGR
ncbi:MAG: hypothetical protein ACRDSJ_21320 [Rubrobacteraceae bacterium]